MRRETIAAIDRLVAAGLEGNLGLLATIRANRAEHLARSTAAILRAERSAALRATTGLVLEALLRIERLFRRREDEFLAAIAADEGFVLIHGDILLKKIYLHRLALRARLPVGGARRIQGGPVANEKRWFR